MKFVYSSIFSILFTTCKSVLMYPNLLTKYVMQTQSLQVSMHPLINCGINI